MTEINLLPDELRGQDRKESNKEKPGAASYDIAWTSPPEEKSQPSQASTKKPAWLGFAKQSVDKNKKIYNTIAKEQDKTNNQTLLNIDQSNNRYENNQQSATTKKSVIPKKTGKKFGLLKIFYQKKANRKKMTTDSSAASQGKNSLPLERNMDNIDVNLIPKDLTVSAIPELGKLFKGSMMSILSSIVMLSAVFGGLLWYEYYVTAKANELRGRITALDNELRGLDQQKNQALKAQQRLSVVRDLLDQHVYWSKFFGFLEKSTINEIYYTNFSMNGRDRLVISAVGKDYDSVAKQLVAFGQSNDFIKNVRVDSASAVIDSDSSSYAGVEFNVHLEFQPGVFFKPLE